MAGSALRPGAPALQLPRSIIGLVSSGPRSRSSGAVGCTSGRRIVAEVRPRRGLHEARRIVQWQQDVHRAAATGRPVQQVARQGVEHQQFAVRGQVEEFPAILAEQQRLQFRHRVQRLRPDPLQPADHRGVVLQHAAFLPCVGPWRGVGIEALVEAVARALVGGLVTPAVVDVQQLEVGQRAGTPGIAQVRHQEVDRRIVLPQHDEELGLLLEVDQLLGADIARHLDRRRRHPHQRQGLLRERHLVVPGRRRHRGRPGNSDGVG